MDNTGQMNIQQAYELESTMLEREFFDKMKAGKTLDELKPILLKLKHVKLLLAQLTGEENTSRA